MKSNFSFMKNIDNETFEILLDVEKRAKIEPYHIGNPIRQVLEHLCTIQIEKYDLVEEILEECQGKIPPLFEQLRLLRDRNGFLLKVRSNPGRENIEPMPCFKVNLEYRDETGKMQSRFKEPDRIKENEKNTFQWADAFLRQVGNDFSHYKNPFIKRVFKKNYENVIYALKTLQKYVKLFFGIDERSVPPFNEDIMPVDNYEIISAKIPADTERTSCEKEYIARRYEDMKKESVGYSVIRQYPRTDKKAVFLRRAPDVYLAGDNCGALLNKVTIISEGGDNDNPFYLVAYDFRREAFELNTPFLSSLKPSERLSLCLEYAKNMALFHNNSTPIYHRVFSSGCAYYSDERKSGRGIGTAIIKFEYAKIADNQTETVIGPSPQAEMFTNKDDKRYIAKEWNELKEPTLKDWAKVDIYSLGILFCDILMGKIGGYQFPELRRFPEYTKILPLISKMISLKDSRPDINSVIDYLEKEVVSF